MQSHKKEPKDYESPWLIFTKATSSLISLGRLIYDFVKLFTER